MYTTGLEPLHHSSADVFHSNVAPQDGSTLERLSSIVKGISPLRLSPNQRSGSALLDVAVGGGGLHCDDAAKHHQQQQQTADCDAASHQLAYYGAYAPTHYAL